MPKPWLKMWIEWIHDPKMLALSWDEKGMWWGVVTLAQQCEADGRLVKGDGTPLNRQDIAMCLHISKKADLRTLNSMLDKMQKADSLSWKDDTLFIIHFGERQALYASATKEAIRERVRRHRQQQTVTEKPLQSTDNQETKMALSLSNELRQQLSKLPSLTNKQLEHEVTREALINVGQLKGYITNQQVTTPSGRIDLTWTDKMGNPIAAFEIDDELPKEKSLENLKSIVYPLRIIILRSSSRPPGYIEGILIIGLQTDVTEKPLPPLTTPEALAKEIRATLMALPEPIDYLVEHEIIKDTLAKLAQGRGLVPKSEVTTDTGRIDLLWEEPTGEIVAAFEIDVYEPRKKSLAKLNSLDCSYTFVILRSNPQPLQREGDILLIGLSKERESSKEKEDKEEEVEAEVEKTPLQHTVTSVTSEPVLAEISQLYEKNFGIITPILAEKFKDFAENYRGPIGWIRDAFEEACSQNVRKWVYVEKILEAWQAEGRKPRGKGKQQRKDIGPGAHRRGDREATADELRKSLER